MSTLREAAQQALEAMEFVGEDMPHWAAVKRVQAITALRDALAQEEQEPAIYPDEAREMGLEEVALYTRPPRREWWSLPEFEIDDLSRTMVKGHKSVNWLARAIETKLKEKNT